MPIIQSRRKFLTGLATLVAAPAIVKVSSLMPVRPDYLMPYKGMELFDAGVFYCPYVPLSIVNTWASNEIIDYKSRRLSFKTRYGLV